MPPARRAIFALAIAFFCLPVALRMVGVTARDFENRPFAPRPSLSQGWDVFEATTRFAVDRLPLREQAVRAHTWVALDVLGTSPSWRQELLAGERLTAALPGQQAAAAPVGPAAPKPAGGAAGQAAGAVQVIDADDGWLLLGMDLERACAPALPRPEVIRRMRALIALLRGGGRRVAFVVPPDKTTVYPRRVPADEPRRACAERYRARAWPALEALRDPAVVPLRRRLLEAQARTDELLYRRKDSHWNTLGASVALAPTLAPLAREVRVEPGEIVVRPPLEYVGDLTQLRGAPEQDTTPDRAVERTPGAPVLPGVTTLVHDSFGGYLAPLLAPYAKRLDALAWPTVDPAAMAAAALASRQVIIEIVERELDAAFADDGRMTALTAALRAQLEAAG